MSYHPAALQSPDLTREQWLRDVLVWTSQNIFGCGDANCGGLFELKDK